MKIHFLVYNIFGMGGTGRTVLNVANYLAEKNYDVEIISVFKRQAQGFFEIDPRIKVTVLHDTVTRNSKGKDVKTKVANQFLKLPSLAIHYQDEAYRTFRLLTDIKIISYIKKINSGILITTRPSFNLLAVKYANKGVTLVGQEHLNIDIYPKRLKKSMLKNYAKLDYLLTLTDDDTVEYTRSFEGKSVEVRKITNSIPKLESMVSNLEEKTIMAAGRLVEQKGFDLLIESFNYIKDEFPDWRVKIFGFGRDKKMLEALIQQYHLYNNVILMGPTKNIEKELAKSSIYALSSRFEGFGMVIVEAMQCGVPVVSYDCPKGPSEIINNNVDGILVDNGNVKEFAEKLALLMRDKNLREQIAKEGLISVKRFEIDQIGLEWEKLFEDIQAHT
ncbi:glycosyltransferase family 4 protein [Alkalihalobacillus pseudalcaliphilus]|uniref:glycosyltransferase family 4 protein n=1 Tax=Alkalihalobacillus pseudalcaliphilus TaxID=79884 RepID=UPI00064DD947|nr:glycosyltransferase family 4 protein [Alkalihalobacillus pseudalcaliphilus]KMK77408.1 UDP-glucose:polyglycerol phosphate glucosyltransferase [Alkalihalobacillus pseudalcaliphilus]